MDETPVPHLDLISKGPSWVLCNLAVAAMEEIHAQHPGRFTWTLVDISKPEGIKRLQELRPRCGRMIPVPGVVVDDRIVFDHIPQLDEFTEWLLQGLPG